VTGAARTLVLACALWLACAAIACAQQALSVSSELSGRALGRSLSLLEDREGTLTLADVTGKLAARFVSAGVQTPSFGHSASVYWVRLEVHNERKSARAWLLEVAYPHLDDLTLYVPQPGAGFTARCTGDMRPFDQRDVAYRNFVFSLEEPARSQQTYYLRVASSGSLTLPLAAWTPKAFIEHQQVDWTVLCIFYGVILVMIAYNACVYAFTRLPEYPPYVGFISSIGLLQFTVAGHTFQFLLPRSMQLVHQLVPVSIAATLMFGIIVVRSYLPKQAGHARLLERSAWYFGLCTLLSFVVPYGIAIPVLIVSGLVPLVSTILLTASLLRSGDKGAKLLLVGWGSTVLGASVYVLQSIAVLPIMFLTTWSIQIALSIQVVLLSSVLADRINSARRALRAVHVELSQKVTALSTAVLRAEEAAERAQRATRAKEEFLATMSHEFRTPLNPIINFPQGMLEEFVSRRFAICEGCRSTFELEQAETISEATGCPDCGAAGGMIEKVQTRYRGDPTRARAFLQTIEHAGNHLLRLVNGILDFSKMEAGHLSLVREPFSPAQLVRQVVDELNQPFGRPRVRVSLAPELSSYRLRADPERIRQVLVQLIGNAAKFSDPSQDVQVCVERTKVGCRISVRDRGIGIAPSDLGSIFESFEQVHKGNTRRYGGTGLGLSISRSLVRMHGGDMWVESEVGEGSTFVFEVPDLQRSSAPVARSA
jgi:two-component system, sensor histidine kinase LadS